MRTVSVIMPCFNHSRFIRQSVNSVMGQEYESLELIVVDDCSSDGSWEIISELAAADSRIKPIRHERNCGAARSRNDGIRASRGEFIAFCDADDLWEPQKLQHQIGLLDRHTDRDIAYGDARIIDEEGELTGKRFSDLFPPPSPASGFLFPLLVRTNFINTQSVLMRRECVTQVGMFDEHLKGASVEDWWYWIRLSHRYRFVYSDECLGKYRMHSASTSLVNSRSYAVSRYKVFRRMLRDYPGLPATVRARARLTMGVDLCELGRARVGRRLLWSALTTSATHPQAYIVGARALRQLLVRSRIAGTAGPSDTRAADCVG